MSRARLGKELPDSLWYLKPTIRHESILVQRVRLLPPTTSVQKAGSAHTPPLGLLFSVDEGIPEPFLKVAALSGFKQMKFSHVTKLIKDLGCGGGFKKQPTEKTNARPLHPDGGSWYCGEA